MVVQTTFFEGDSIPNLDNLIEQIYSLYPRRVGSGAARRAIKKAIGKVGPETLLRAVKEYAKSVSKWHPDQLKYVPHPSTWFNQERWDDDRSSWDRTSSEERKSSPRQSGNEYEYEFRVKTL